MPSITSLPQIAERHVMVNSSRSWEPTTPTRILLRSSLRLRESPGLVTERRTTYGHLSGYPLVQGRTVQEAPAGRCRQGRVLGDRGRSPASTSGWKPEAGKIEAKSQQARHRRQVGREGTSGCRGQDQGGARCRNRREEGRCRGCRPLRPPKAAAAEICRRRGRSRQAPAAEIVRRHREGTTAETFP